MLRYDHHPARQRDVIAQRDAILDTIVDYRFLAPQKIAADERIRQGMALAAQALDDPAPDPDTGRSSVRIGLRLRLGAALIAAGTRLQRGAAGKLDPRPGT
jgi:hypothetical protein